MSPSDFGPDSYLPPTDELTAPWWDATRRHVLLLQQCRSCRSKQWHPRYLCLACGSAELGWVPVSGRGVLDTFTVVNRSPRPGLVTPYILARVRLAEGPVMLSRIVGDQESPLACDQPVVLDWHDLADGRSLPVFHSDSSPADGGTLGGL